ncbi:MAG: molybdate ABC transporter substrate-binding protein [Actinomycetota bacterium]
MDSSWPLRAVTLLLAVALLTSCTADDSLSHDATGLSPEPRGHEITVLAASSLTDAFEEIGSRFESAVPGVHVTFSFAGSDTLASQILQGAPADTFASASPTQMGTVAQAHKIYGHPTQFATNRLEVITPTDNPGGISSIQDLARPGVTVVLAASGVPSGDYARQIFVKLGIYEAVTANVVSNELDDQSVVSKVRLGEADAGIVYVSDLSGGANGQVRPVPIPKSSNVVAKYEIAPLKDASYLLGGRLFEEFVLSTQGQAVLRKYGFGAG